MEFLQQFSKIMMIPPVIMFVWDLIEGWFVKNTIRLQTMKEWGDKISKPGYAHVHNLMQSLLPHNWDAIEKMPGCVVIFVPAFGLYVLYRLIFLLAGGKQGGYKSRY